MHQLPDHRASTGDFFPPLDGIRGLAVLSVVVFHTAYFNPEHPLQHALFSLTLAGFMGVQIFFVLSGFLIPLTIIRSAENFSAKAYAIRRAAKILPPFIISLVVFACAALIWDQPRHVWASAVAFLLTLPNFTSGWDGINPVYWSLMVEMHFYAVFPLLYFCLRGRVDRPALWCSGIFFVVPTIVRLGMPHPWGADRGTWFAHAQIFPKALDNFALGILFADMVTDRKRYAGFISRSRSLVVIGVLILGAAYALFACIHFRTPLQGPDADPNPFWTFELFRLLPTIGSFFLLFCVFLPSGHWLNRLLTSAPLAYLGLVSYEWFLFHYPPVQILMHQIGRAQGSVGVYLVRTIAPALGSLGFALLLYHSISRPILDWAKKMSRVSRKDHTVPLTCSTSTLSPQPRPEASRAPVSSPGSPSSETTPKQSC